MGTLFAQAGHSMFELSCGTIVPNKLAALGENWKNGLTRRWFRELLLLYIIIRSIDVKVEMFFGSGKSIRSTEFSLGRCET